jgi:uncharacterized ubiquitin-like protein YukD
MGKVEVEIVDHTASKRKKAELPDSVPVGRIISVLITKMNLPTTDPSGQPVTYHLDHKQSGKRLMEDQTLKNSGVQNGDVLRIFPRIEAG